MNNSQSNRLFRFLFGAIAIVAPIAALVFAQMTPPAAQTVQAAAEDFPSETMYALGASLQVTPTNTPTNTPTHTPTNTPTQTNTPTTTSSPTNTPTRTPKATPIYVDQYEPNNSIQAAYDTAAGLVLPLITLYPVSDIDYFRFVGKAGSAYEVFTKDLEPGLDTFLTVYDTNGNVLATNDDSSTLTRASKVTISAAVNGFYYASIVNLDPSDPTDKTYSLEVKEILGTATPTAQPTGTRVPTVDECEWNGSFQDACLIELSKTYDLDFVPTIGDGPDNDFFRVWVKSGLYYTCETLNLSSVNDTNMIMYSGPGDQYGVGGNDDKDRAAGDLGSEVSFLANYTGWLYVLVGPYAAPEYEYSYLYTYSLECRQVESTPTPTPTVTPTSLAAPGGGNGGGGGLGPSPTPFVFPTFPPTPTAINLNTPQPTTRPQVQIAPLPTVTPPAGAGQRSVTLDITLYYDSNNNFMPELNEGIMDVGVGLYDNATNQLLFFGYTNEAGNIRFGPFLATGPVRVSVPFLNYSQLVGGESANILLRVAPQPLPGTIP